MPNALTKSSKERGGNALNIGFPDDGGQCLFIRASVLQEFGEVAALA